MKRIILFLLFPLYLAAKGISQAGSLDLTFGNICFALVDGNDFFKLMQAMQPDGKIVVGRTNYEGDIVILKFNSNGSLDNRFSDG